VVDWPSSSQSTRRDPNSYFRPPMRCDKISHLTPFTPALSQPSWQASSLSLPDH
jgi:hypothetical protein